MQDPKKGNRAAKARFDRAIKSNLTAGVVMVMLQIKTTLNLNLQEYIYILYIYLQIVLFQVLWSQRSKTSWPNSKS